MTQYCDYSTFQFTQALPGANEPITRVFFSMNNVWSGMMPNRKSKPKLLTDHLKNISVPCSARTDFHELIKSNNRLLNVEWKALSGAREMETQRTDRQYSIGRGHKTLEMVLIWSIMLIMKYKFWVWQFRGLLCVGSISIAYDCYWWYLLSDCLWHEKSAQYTVAHCRHVAWI